MANLTSLAEELNLSVSTISRALNNDETLVLNKETRQKIINLADERGYLEKIGKKKPNFMIYYCQEEHQDLIDPFFKELKQSIFDICDQKGFNYYFFTRKKIPEAIININGIIAIGTYNNEEIALLKKYSDNIIFVNSLPDLHYFDSIVVDDQGAMEECLNILKNNNILNVGFIGGHEIVQKENKPRFNYRAHFFNYYVNELNLINFGEYIGEYSSNSAYKMMNDIILENNLANVYICASDSIAKGAIQALQENKILIPEHVQIIGFNNDKFSEEMSPKISTISILKNEMASLAIETVYNRLHYPRKINQRIVIPTTFIQRETTSLK